MNPTQSVFTTDVILQLPVNPDFVRVLPDPIEPKAKSRAIACINVKTVLESGLGDWLEANVRFQNMKTSIAKAIVRTLDEQPENMHPLNRGITVLASGFRYDSQSKTLHIHLRDPKRHGIIDGGHSFRSIEQVVQKREAAGKDAPNAYVMLEILSGYEDISSDIISARNSVCQVRDSAIYNLDMYFDEIRVHLKKAGIEQMVAFKQNEEGKQLSIEEVIAACTIFHPRFNDGTSHPIKAYTSRGGCIEGYAEEWRQFKESGNPDPWRRGYGKIVHLVADFLKLAELIELEADETYRKHGGLKGFRDEAADQDGPQNRGRKLQEMSGPRDLPITEKTVRSGWPAGYLYPLVASMRPLLDCSGEVARWRVKDPMQVFTSVSKELVQTLMDFAEKYGRKPNAIGKEGLCWKSLLDTVEKRLYKELSNSV